MVSGPAAVGPPGRRILSRIWLSEMGSPEIDVLATMILVVSMALVGLGTLWRRRRLDY